MVASDGSEITLFAENRCYAELVLLDGETRIPWPFQGQLKGADVGGNGRLTTRNWQFSQVQLCVDHAGLYRFTLPNINGNLEHAPVEAFIEDRSEQEIRVHLERLP